MDHFTYVMRYEQLYSKQTYVHLFVFINCALSTNLEFYSIWTNNFSWQINMLRASLCVTPMRQISVQTAETSLRETNVTNIGANCWDLLSTWHQCDKWRCKLWDFLSDTILTNTDANCWDLFYTWHQLTKWLISRRSYIFMAFTKFEIKHIFL